MVKYVVMRKYVIYLKAHVPVLELKLSSISIILIIYLN